MKLILHIGTDKTGSTAIQKHLYVNRSWLLARGVYVPLTGLGKDNGHGDLLATMDEGQMTELSGEIIAAREAGCRYAVISWEGMCFMGVKEITRLNAALAFDKPWLLVYLREQADIVQTGYLQELKTDGSRVDISDFQGIIWKPSRLRALRYCYSPMRNYARLLRQWMTIIPKGQVIAREFQRDLLVGNNVIDDFLAVLDLSADDEFVRFNINTNISLDVESAIIVNNIDRRTDLKEPRKTYIYSLLSIIHSDGFGHRYFLSARRVASIRRHYKKSNRAIGKIIGSPLPQLFSRAPPCACNYTTADIRDSVRRKEQRFGALHSTPMLFVTKFPHELPNPDILASGWKEFQDWGAWSEGDASEIRFRIPFWMISHETASVNIFIKGRYRSENTQSRVIVNGVDFGWLDLRRFDRSISLPVSALQPNQAVAIRIHHGDPQLPADDPRVPETKRNAFGIEKFGIQFSNPE